MIIGLVRLDDGLVVHVGNGPGRALCEETARWPVAAAWHGDSSEISCPACRAVLAATRTGEGHGRAFRSRARRRIGAPAGPRGRASERRGGPPPG